MLNHLRRNNPKNFYRKFERKNKKILCDITIEQFQEHFKNLMNKEIIPGTDNDMANSDNIFGELHVPFTDIEIEKHLKFLKNKSVL